MNPRKWVVPVMVKNPKFRGFAIDPNVPLHYDEVKGIYMPPIENQYSLLEHREFDSEEEMERFLASEDGALCK